MHHRVRRGGGGGGCRDTTIEGMKQGTGGGGGGRAWSAVPLTMDVMTRCGLQSALDAGETVARCRRGARGCPEFRRLSVPFCVGSSSGDEEAQRASVRWAQPRGARSGEGEARPTTGRPRVCVCERSKSRSRAQTRLSYDAAGGGREVVVFRSRVWAPMPRSLCAARVSWVVFDGRRAVVAG